MKKLPVGIQNFRKIIEGNFVYVDKTSYIYNLLSTETHYFLSRPRRFGKSLLLDTIAEVFNGDKSIFEGLFIYDSDYNFVKHPVIRLDMSNISCKSPDILEASLLSRLKERIKEEDLAIDNTIPSELFLQLIKSLKAKYGQNVVILIDEYDKPIIDNITDTELAEANRDVLKSFYGILKSMDPFISFSLITGVTKFTKTSVFSGLNNLRDITLTAKYANICGITHDDLDNYFTQHLEYLRSLKSFEQFDDLRKSILEWYDGYSWDGVTRVINPFDLLCFFSDEKFSSYWYASGTPAFLIDIIKRRPDGYSDLTNLEISEWAFDTFDIDKLTAGPLLFQTGYLTIKNIINYPPPSIYVLEIPNYEVKMAFNLNILSEFTEKDASYTELAFRKINESLKTRNLDLMLTILKSMFSSIPYELHIKREAYYHSIFIALMSVLGFDIDSEVSVANGRIDAAIEYDNIIYIFEFKYHELEKNISDDKKHNIIHKNLDDGIDQIKNREYYSKYLYRDKTIILSALLFLGRDDIEMKVEIFKP